MTINGWIIFAFCAVVSIFLCVMGWWSFDKKYAKVLVTVVASFAILALFFGMRWYYTSTANGRRLLVDQKSNLSNGIERTITVYTANGEVIAEYSGKIDIDVNDGGYIKFDFEGKRYIYYNCFVESIANIE